MLCDRLLDCGLLGGVPNSTVVGTMRVGRPASAGWLALALVAMAVDNFRRPERALGDVSPALGRGIFELVSDAAASPEKLSVLHSDCSEPDESTRLGVVELMAVGLCGSDGAHSESKNILCLLCHNLQWWALSIVTCTYCRREIYFRVSTTTRLDKIPIS
jgi:hypothetical protein